MSRSLLAALAAANLMGAAAIVLVAATHVSARQSAGGGLEIKLVPVAGSIASGESLPSARTDSPALPADDFDPDAPPWRTLPDGSVRTLR